MTNVIKRDNTNGSHTSRPDLPLGTWVDDVLKNTFNRFFEDDFFRTGDVLRKGSVPVNITETDKTFELELVAPGLKKEDFSVNLNNNMLTVAYDHKEENKQEDKHGNLLRQEYRMEAFSRSFTLDETIDAENISGQYINGVLHLTIPKKEGAILSKNIEIR